MESARPPILPTVTAQIVVDLELILLALAFAGLLVLGVVIVIRVRRWRVNADESPNQIEHYRALLEQGALGPDEFARIRDHLENKAAMAAAPTRQEPVAPAAIKPTEPPKAPETNIQDLG